MTKKESKNGSSKNQSHDKESGLACLKEVEVQINNDKKTNKNNNSTNIQSTYSTPRESILEIPNNSKYPKGYINRPHSAPQIQTSKKQCFEPPRSSRRTLERQDTPRPRSETPPSVRRESCELKIHSKSKLKEIASQFFKAIQKKNKLRSNSQISHHRLHHKSWSPRNGHSISLKASVGRYGNIPKSPKGYYQYNCSSPKLRCDNRHCDKRRCKSRFAIHY